MKEKIISAIIDVVKSLADVKMPGTGDGLAQIVGSASSLSAFTTLTTIGSALIVCLFLIHFADSAIKDKQDPDSLFKDIALLVLYGIIVNNLPGIIGGLSSFCQDILNAVSGINITDGWGTAASSNLSTFETDLRENMKDHNLILLLFDMILYFVLGNIAKMIILGVAFVAIYTVKIELFIRTLFAPIAVALLAEDGWRGAGGRYIKKWSACFIQLAIIQVALTSYGVVLGLALGEGQGFTFIALIAAGFAAAGVCMKSGQLANDVMGG